MTLIHDSFTMKSSLAREDAHVNKARSVLLRALLFDDGRQCCFAGLADLLLDYNPEELVLATHASSRIGIRVQIESQ